MSRPVRNRALRPFVLIAVAAACRQPSQADPIRRAAAFMQTQSDANEYWLDSVRAYEGDSVWSVSFLRIDHVVRRPNESLVRVNKRTGDVWRVPDR